jgi:hypothetical protein
MSEISHQRSAKALRIGTADREHAASALGEHFAAGRLDTDEFDERVGKAYQAKTSADIAVLFADLPDTRRTTAPRKRRDRPHPAAGLRVLIFVSLVLAVAAWVAIVHIPPFFLIPVLWIAFARHRFPRHPRRAW